MMENITSIKVNKGEQLTVGQVFLEIESEEATKTQKVIQNIETQSIPKVEVQLPVESSNNNKVYKTPIYPKHPRCTFCSFTRKRIRSRYRTSFGYRTSWTNFFSRC